MAGLFGFFGKKKDNGGKDQAKPTETNGSKPEAYYFLDADQAKSFGNIEYMRTAKTVRRTFPKTVGNGGTFERIQTVSTMEAVKAEALKSAMAKAEVDAAKAAANPSAVQPGSETARRRSDSSMDIFRNMARDMRKK